MSRLCRLKTKSHGEDGKWAYNEIINLRQQIAESQARKVKLREALEMIAGKRYCLDVLMSNSDIANEAPLPS